MKRVLVFAYGVINYAISVAVMTYLACFLGNLFVPRSIDAEPVGSLWEALLVDALLVTAFGLQHSIMARPKFKEWWTRIVPPPAERSTYVLFSNLALILLFWQWQPIGGVIWDASDFRIRCALHGVYVTGWVAVFGTTFLINHFDLFGLRQVWLYLLGKPYTSLPFRTPGPYRLIRHPLYVGWFIVFWATPTMTVAHLIFALGMTAYILIAIPFEERDLADHHGEAYTNYRRSVPMLIPIGGGSEPEKVQVKEV
ncbi:MAG TPA: isoprenylcysteine carboxylmethyltransferase family protein [Gemmataceae bacterium]|nr:isoprenylcysteine carboxylmethyltransferase family protein [Gemmataceae bacterium]